jgi:hypothetical protein
MKSKIINWLAEAEQGTLSVCVTYSTGRNIALSLKAAEHIAKKTELGNVLYINSVQTSRQLGASIRRYANPDFTSETEDSRIIYESAPAGMLMDDMEEHEHYLESERVKYVIINCWEMASKDYRRKSDLIFTLNRWMHEYGVTIIVFAESNKTSPEAGRIHRGMGIGKLALIAKQVRVFKKKEKENRIIPKYLTTPSQESIQEFEEYLKTPIPVWMPRTANEERAGFAEYDRRHITIESYLGESPQAFRKRMLEYIGKDMQHRPEDYERWLGDEPFRIEEAPEEYFYTQLPEGDEIKPKSYWSPDRGPKRGRHHDMSSLEITDTGIEDRSDETDGKSRARAKLL